jgi:hypothetical protein
MDEEITEVRLCFASVILFHFIGNFDEILYEIKKKVQIVSKIVTVTAGYFCKTML